MTKKLALTTKMVRSVVCPNCNAQIRKPCTRPTDNGRANVTYHHFAREAAAKEQAWPES